MFFDPEARAADNYPRGWVRLAVRRPNLRSTVRAIRVRCQSLSQKWQVRACRSAAAEDGLRHDRLRDRLTGTEGAPEIELCHCELDPIGTARGDGEADAAHADAHLSAELEELQANGLDGSCGELRVLERDP